MEDIVPRKGGDFDLAWGYASAGNILLSAVSQIRPLSPYVSVTRMLIRFFSFSLSARLDLN